MFHSLMLNLFLVLSEYFVSACLMSSFFVIFFFTYKIFNLVPQKSLSESISFFLFLTLFIIFNDNLVVLDFEFFNDLLILDYLSFFIKFFICLTGFVYFLVIADFLKYQKLVFFEYLLTLLFSILGLVLMCSSNDILIIYLAVELSSFSFYILASFDKTSYSSIDSGIKYFITGAISSSGFLLGSSFLYGLFASINITDLSNINATCFNFMFFNDFFYSHFILVDFGLMLILVSLYIKLSLAPFHLWSLDVYEGSPTASAFFFAVMTKLSIFVVLVRFCYKGFFNVNQWQFYSLWIGVLSIYIGSFGGLGQKRLKTLLAYSAISHMGYSIIAFYLVTFEGIQTLLFYLIIYIASSLFLWYIVLMLQLRRKKLLQKQHIDLGDLAILRNNNTILALTCSIIIFSIAGIPPLIGFLAKLNVFKSIVYYSLYIILVLITIFSVISTFYYFRIIKILCYENLLLGRLYYPIRTNKLICVLYLFYLIIFLFVFPSYIYIKNYTILSYFF